MLKDKYGYGVICEDGVYWFESIVEAHGFYIRNKELKCSN